MQVQIFNSVALVRNSYGQVAKLEGVIFKFFLKTIEYRKKTSKKRAKTIASEILQDWSDAGSLEWHDVNNANT